MARKSANFGPILLLLVAAFAMLLARSGGAQELSPVAAPRIFPSSAIPGLLPPALLPKECQPSASEMHYCLMSSGRDSMKSVMMGKSMITPQVIGMIEECCGVFGRIAANCWHHILPPHTPLPHFVNRYCLLDGRN